MNIIVLVFIRVTLAFMAASCQDDRTQGQQSGIKTAKSTVELHSACQDIYVATEVGAQMAGCWVLQCEPAQGRPRKSEGPTSRCSTITAVIFVRIGNPVMRKPT
jgi:hypothetical protein